MALAPEFVRNSDGKVESPESMIAKSIPDAPCARRSESEPFAGYD